MPVVSSFPPSRVVLFKTPPPCSQNDAYAHALLDAGYASTYIRTLTDSFDVDELARLLSGSGIEPETWDGVIITSKRGAEGWVRAARRVLVADGQTPQVGGSGLVSWDEVPLYTVGQTALDVFASARSTTSDLVPLLPRDDAGGITTAKSAFELIPLLLPSPPAAHLSEGETPDLVSDERTSMTKRYLFIRGDKSLETIQPALRTAGHVVREVQVYSTGPSPSLGADIAAALSPDAVLPMATDGQEQERERTASHPTSTLTWLAFFSPSSATYVLPLLPADIARSISASAPEHLPARQTGIGTKVLAIGETTRAFLLAQAIRVDAVAATPDAAGLMAAVVSSDADNHGSEGVAG